jgi:hypothetical protein
VTPLRLALSFETNDLAVASVLDQIVQAKVEQAHEAQRNCATFVSFQPSPHARFRAIVPNIFGNRNRASFVAAIALIISAERDRKLRG